LRSKHFISLFAKQLKQLKQPDAVLCGWIVARVAIALIQKQRDLSLDEQMLENKSQARGGEPCKHTWTTIESS